MSKFPKFNDTKPLDVRLDDCLLSDLFVSSLPSPIGAKRALKVFLFLADYFAPRVSKHSFFHGLAHLDLFLAAIFPNFQLFGMTKLGAGTESFRYNTFSFGKEFGRRTVKFCNLV